MDKNLDSLLYILFHMGIKPSRYIAVYRDKGCSIGKTNRYFLKYGSGKAKLTVERDTGMYTRILADIGRGSYRAVCIGSSEYPGGLDDIYLPPPVLFCRGKRLGNGIKVAVVGSRRCTGYGRKAAAYISGRLSDTGITVVSGLARGIDSLAHINSAGKKGGTVAVMGSGPDIVYPPENRGLHSQIISRGTVITEFPPGTPPIRQNFPIRNRIISGISKGVVIIEASIRSGAMITGETALEQNREVFAVPGSIFSVCSRGCHRLIKAGAKLVEDIDDILEELQGCGA